MVERTHHPTGDDRAAYGGGIDMPDEGGVIPRKLLGQELRKLREAARQTLTEVADVTLISTSKLSRLENGQGLPQLRDVRDLARHYGISGTSLEKRFYAWVEESRSQPWWDAITTVRGTDQQYFSFESAASEISLYLARLIPSLLQSEAYAAGLLRSWNVPPPADLQQLVTIRMNRQLVWKREDRPARLDVIIDESALLRQVGTPDDMGAQLTSIATTLEKPGSPVTLRILELSRGPHWASREGTFAIFSFPADVHPDVAYHDYSEKYVSDPESIHRFLDRADALTDISLSPEESITHLRRVAFDRYHYTEVTQ